VTWHPVSGKKISQVRSSLRTSEWSEEVENLRRVDESRERRVGPSVREDPGEQVCEDVSYVLGPSSRGEASRKREPRPEDENPGEVKTQEGTEPSDGEQPTGEQRTSRGSKTLKPVLRRFAFARKRSHAGNGKRVRDLREEARLPGMGKP